MKEKETVIKEVEIAKDQHSAKLENSAEFCTVLQFTEPMPCRTSHIFFLQFLHLSGIRMHVQSHPLTILLLLTFYQENRMRLRFEYLYIQKPAYRLMEEEKNWMGKAIPLPNLQKLTD
jgi:hypothetical protein